MAEHAGVVLYLVGFPFDKVGEGQPRAHIVNERSSVQASWVRGESLASPALCVLLLLLVSQRRGQGLNTNPLLHSVIVNAYTRGSLK